MLPASVLLRDEKLGVARTQELLAARKIAVCVVSMPSTTVFDRQDAAYRERGETGATTPRSTRGWDAVRHRR